MRIRQIRILKVILLIFVVSLCGCATDKAVLLKDAKSIGPIKVVRYETPPMQVWSRANTGIARGSLLFGHLIVKSSVDKQSKALSESANLPDYTELVMQGFAKRIGAEFPDWPKMQVESRPVKDTYKYDGGTLLVFSAYANVSFDGGLLCGNIVTMTDQSGMIIWKKESKYRTNELNKDYPMPLFGYEIEIFTADNGKFLKEEMSNAADWTIKDLIKHLKGEK